MGFTNFNFNKQGLLNYRCIFDGFISCFICVRTYQLRTLVQDCDPDAFLIVLSTEEVLGEGFKRIEQKP